MSRKDLSIALILLLISGMSYSQSRQEVGDELAKCATTFWAYGTANNSDLNIASLMESYGKKAHALSLQRISKERQTNISTKHFELIMKEIKKSSSFAFPWVGQIADCVQIINLVERKELP